MRHDVTIVSNRQIAKATMEMKVRCPGVEIAPGTFFHIKTSGLLRRPLSVANVEGDEITFLYKVIGEGTTELSGKRVGDTLDVLGPLGNGFPLAQHGKRVVLVGGGIGVPPLYYVRRRLHEMGIETIAILGFDSKESVFMKMLFVNWGRRSSRQ